MAIGQSRQTDGKQTAIERYRLFDITKRAATPVIGTSHTVFVDVGERTRHDADWPIRLHRQVWQHDARHRAILGHRIDIGAHPARAVMRQAQTEIALRRRARVHGGEVAFCSTRWGRHRLPHFP